MNNAPPPFVATPTLPRFSSNIRPSASLNTLAMALAVLLVLLATVFRGGNRALPLVALEWLALGVLLALSWRSLTTGQWPAGLGAGRWAAARWALAAAPLWVAAWQLLPWPGMGPLSVTPQATAFAALAGLPLVASCMIGITASRTQLHTLVLLWVGVAVAQALLGLVQLGGFEALYFGLDGREPSIGTYASKNTYANLLAMALPLAVLRLWGTSPPKRHGRFGFSWWAVAAMLALLAAVLASTSRTGIATALLVCLLALALLAPAPEQGASRWNKRRLWLPLLAISLLGAALFMGGLDWVDRFESETLVRADALRALTREATWLGAMTFWPFGSGLGSYAWVFPRFQSPEVGRFLLDLAHSEYLQILMETGALGLIAMALALALMGRRVLQLFRSTRGTSSWGSADRVAVASGLGLLATLLHAWVDYPFRIPANAMLAAFLLGVFLREPTPAPDGKQK